MLYSKKMKLDTTNRIELRISKTEKIRKHNLELEKDLGEYIKSNEKTLELEKKILKNMNFLFSCQSSFQKMIENYSLTLKFKEEIQKRELALLKKNLEKKNSDLFFNLKPLIKDYFITEKRHRHYSQKIPKLNSKFSEKQKINTLTEKEKLKLMRNDVKLEKSQKLLINLQNRIIQKTNHINLERFKITNPLISYFFSSQFSPCFLLKEKIEDFENMKNNLRKNEKEDYNPRFFLERKPIGFKKMESIRENIRSVKKDIGLMDNDYDVRSSFMEVDEREDNDYGLNNIHPSMVNIDNNNRIK